MAHVLDLVMTLASSTIPWILLGIGALAYAGVRRSVFAFTVLFVLIAAVIGTNLLCLEVVKPFFASLRSCQSLTRIGFTLLCRGSEVGLPSGHAADGMAAATIGIWVGNRYLRLGAVVGALLIGMSRIYLGAHSLPDVLIAYVFGGVVGTLTFCAFVPKDWRHMVH